MKQSMTINFSLKRLLATALLACVSLPLFADSSAATTTSTSHPKSLAQQAFQDMLKNYYPLTPSQIHEFKNRAVVQEQANERPAGPAPKEGVSGIIRVQVKPGATMPVVRIGQGMISSIIFTDKAGNIWPVDAYSIGDPTAFNIQWQQKSGVMMIQGKKYFAQTNMGVLLHGMQVPIMITLLIGQHQWDYQDFIRVQSFQPGDSAAAMEDASEAPEFLVKVLDGIPPHGAVPLHVMGADDGSKVWDFNNAYIMLTRSTLLSPEWQSKFDGTGANPMHAYLLQKTPVILVSRGGKLERLTVKEESENA